MKWPYIFWKAIKLFIFGSLDLYTWQLANLSMFQNIKYSNCEDYSLGAKNREKLPSFLLP